MCGLVCLPMCPRRTRAGHLYHNQELPEGVVLETVGQIETLLFFKKVQDAGLVTHLLNHYFWATDARQCITMRRGTCLQTNRIDAMWEKWQVKVLGRAEPLTSLCEALPPPLCWCWQPWGKVALIVNAFFLSIYTHTFDLGRHMRNWLFIHRVTLQP